ncbi:hypothetical protein JNUCC1_02514 [Lentibacillus sp. JNUCC-1]|uniref:helix-turn-helix domain-containing protein n=1 Tax=Lentibacillus sp. JNUCC-1 TaxID=2654513 RepID=UPI0012E76850|nr:helix-turn-helix transcriptional regulator [Lentibacillus sp. JNUCC-1]MUV38660.1 hypothetical protein [Lentibacillus sp. JNUCC-1]
MSKKSYEDLMATLKTAPGVSEHLNKHSVIMGKKILKRRLQLGLTQKEVIEAIRSNNAKITQATLSKVECGDDNITSKTYDKIFNVLGGLEDIEPKFTRDPKKNEIVYH